MENINPRTNKPVKNEGRIIQICGTTGTGKTTMIRGHVAEASMPKYIFDLDGEYRSFKNWAKPINRSADLIQNIQAFKNQVCSLWESVIVFSEAGMLFAHGEMNDLAMRELLKSARRRGNLILMDYHSLSEIPIESLRYTNYLIIKKHAMQSASQMSKFKHYPQIMEFYRNCQRSKDNFHTEIIIPRELDINI